MAGHLFPKRALAAMTWFLFPLTTTASIIKLLFVVRNLSLTPEM